VWGSPRQTGVFTLAQLEEVYRQALDLGTIRDIYFEGGEAFLYYPILVKAVAQANACGFWTGIVSNAYWATSVADALAWLQALVEAGLDRLDLSNDLFHGDKTDLPEVTNGLAAAKQLGLEASTICIDPPTGYRDPTQFEPGAPVTGGGVMYRGRAAKMLVKGLPHQSWQTFTACPYENLANPSRVHLDPLGNLHLCQGLVMGNLFERPLKQIVQEYELLKHPVVGLLIEGGPAYLVQHYGLDHQAGYVDACHLCYLARQALRDRFPEVLGPNQMYGEF
jgi:MoaA/NifB/PqqE/SkfB family radical SAM enzyme